MAHDAMRTWILVALRAATEPVKEEAMQAMIVVMSFGVCVLQSCVCWNGEGDAASLLFTHFDANQANRISLFGQSQRSN